MSSRIFAQFLAVLALCVSQPASADQPDLRIVSESDLRFGSFAVLDRGYREVSAAGSVQSAGIFSVTNGDTGPARFTITYDRGNNGRRNLDLILHVVLSPAPVVTSGGIVARLSSYQTDLPGASRVAAGQIFEIAMPNCRTRICEKTFYVGGRLDIERNFGGARITVPIPIDVTLASVN